MKYFAMSALLAVSTLAVSARAADDEFKPFGYVQVDASRAAQFINGALGDAFTPLHATVADTWGADAHAGYRFNKFLALEAEYEWMNDFNMRLAGLSIGQLQTQVATLNLKVVAPFGAVEPYFTAGFGALWTTISSKPGFVQYDVANGVFTGRFNAGIDWWLTQNLALNLGASFVVNNAKVTAPNGNNGEGIDYLTGQFGFAYRF